MAWRAARGPYRLQRLVCAGELPPQALRLGRRHRRALRRRRLRRRPRRHRRAGALLRLHIMAWAAHAGLAISGIVVWRGGGQPVHDGRERERERERWYPGRHGTSASAQD
jgi:hypothetical protein